MIASGALGENDRLELIEGWLVRKMAKGPAHEYATGQAEDFLRAHLPAGFHVRNQSPITLARSEPEPDLAVARGGRDAYRTRHPGPGDVALIVEVADTSLDVDRLKGKSYGGAGIAAYWIVNVTGRCIEIYADPSDEAEHGYATCRVAREGELAALVIDGHEAGALAVASLFT